MAVLRGYDISHWQSNTAGDSAPDFVIVKATGGDAGLYVDQTCDAKYQRAKSQGKLVGVYHFAGMTDAVQEADFFINNTVGYWQSREAILVLDNETHNNVAWAKTFLDRVQSRTGVKPLIYMSASTIKTANWLPVVQADYGLWVAGYPAKYNVTNPAWTDGSDMPYDVSPWPFAALWQFTSSAGTLDRDVAFMTREGWARYAGKHTPVVTTREVTETSSIAFGKKTVEDSTKQIGYSEITQAGVNGVRAVVYTITLTDGVETSRTVKSDAVVTIPVPEITTVGTMPVPTEPPVEPPIEPPVEPTEPEKPVNPLLLIIQSIIKLIKDILFNPNKK